MTLRAIPFTVAAVWSLVFSIVSQRTRSRVGWLLGALGVLSFVWQVGWVASTTSVFGNQSGFLMTASFAVAFLIPAVLSMLAIEYSGAVRMKAWVPWLVALSITFALLVFRSDTVITGFNTFWWGRSVRAGHLHPMFLIAVGVILLNILIAVVRIPSHIKKLYQPGQLRLIRLAIVLYFGGALDVAGQYGLGIYPTSFFWISVSMGLFYLASDRFRLPDLPVSDVPAVGPDRSGAVSSEMSRLGMVAAFPLVSGGELLGMLLLGEKRSEESYSKEDLLLLRIISNQAALAYQRVRYLELAVNGARTEMLGQISGGFAHEMKTPLANISLPAELSLMEIDDIKAGRRKIEDGLSEIASNLRQIIQQTFKASEKIEAIRQFSKPGQIQLESVSLSQVLQGSLAILDHMLKRLGAVVNIELPEHLPGVTGNGKQLEIVFVNLMKNAAEAMSNMPSEALARRLEIRAHQEGDWVVVRVKDSGPGIKRTHVAHLFEAYFTTKGSSGTGMGLFLSHQVIKAHGGSIDVKSEEGKGTEFIIKLPKFSERKLTDVIKAA